MHRPSSDGRLRDQAAEPSARDDRAGQDSAGQDSAAQDRAGDPQTFRLTAPPNAAPLSSGQLRFRLLGPVEVWRGPRRLALGGPRSERLLALLVSQPGRVVSLDRLVEAVWDTDPPATASHQIRKMIAGLRAVFAPQEVLVTDGPGYRADLTGARVDVAEFDELVSGALVGGGDGPVAAGDDTIARLRAGLSLWRGPALSGTTGRMLTGLALVLDDRRLTALEAYAEACVAADRADEAVAELTAAVREHPLRENLRYLLVLSLCRCGRQAEAFAEYETGRRLLADELGVDPGPALVGLHRRMLRNDPDLRAPRDRVSDTGEPTPGDPEGAAESDDAPATPERPRMGSALPYDTPDFTGRRAEIAALSSVIPDASQRAMIIVTLDGMAGVGKTALAIHTAHRLVDTFTDGQLFLDLRGSHPRPMTPLDALERLLHAVGVQGSAIPAGLDDRSAMWRATISDRSIVLLLDDAASSTQVRPLLPGRAGSVVLVTSRSRLSGLDGAVPIALAPPSHDESVAIVRNLLGNRPVDEPGAVDDLVKECGHLPLAMRIAAGRLQARPLWTVAHLLDRLRDVEDGIGVLSVGDRSVEAAFRLTYDGLSPTSRQAFRRLAMMPVNDFTTSTAAAVTGTTAPRASVLLESLLDARLIEQRTADRYRFHDLVRTFAQNCARREDLCEQRVDSTRAGYEALLHDVRHNVAVYDTGTSTERENAALWLDAETDNVVAAVQAAPALELGRYAVDLCLAIAPHLDVRGLWTTHLQLLQQAATVANALGDTAGELRARVATFGPLMRQGRVDEARSSAQEALLLARVAGDRATEAVCLDDIGSLLRGFGQYQRSVEFHERAIRIHREVGNHRHETSALMSLGLVYGALGRRADALQTAKEALRVLTEHDGDAYGERVQVAHLVDIGVAQSGLGELDAAEVTLRSAVALAHHTDNPYDIATAELNLAKVLLDRACPDGALAGVEAAATAAARLDAPGTPALVADLETVRGRVHVARGSDELAASAYDKAVSHARLAGDRSRQLVALDSYVQLRRSAGDSDGADVLARQAAEITEQLGSDTP